ncbi:predicted protein [Sclerotinia sclerotiorum 1980 UF-70]|uniref:Uncharacterized protein n=1 Tax=Sclerotinia sclerotiorum (strain ATCC 18683 / 1980 / Ss-1) TaxID=665079 RepID=A7ECI1_SCLS1|nr:predicted protein [Sclerotinia sclerotiorum 1980 UF-70]EDO00160.1 predicted protein [Sclerotinia sclerotiorum 1980 UF-70]
MTSRFFSHVDSPDLLVCDILGAVYHSTRSRLTVTKHQSCRHHRASHRAYQYRVLAVDVIQGSGVIASDRLIMRRFRVSFSRSKHLMTT